VEITPEVNPHLKRTIQLHNPSVISLAVVTNKQQLIREIVKTVRARRGNSEASKRWLEKQLSGISGRYTLQKLSPLHLAIVAWAPLDMLKLLIDLGHDVNLVNEVDRRLDPLMLAANLGDVETCRILVANGAHLDMVTRSSTVLAPMHPIHAAAMGNHIEVVRYFVQEAGVSPDIQFTPGFGETPLHVATHRGYFSLVKVLVEELHANYDAANSQDNHKPYTIALQFHRVEIAAYLKSLYERDNRTLPTLSDVLPIGARPPSPPVYTAPEHRREL